MLAWKMLALICYNNIVFITATVVVHYLIQMVMMSMAKTEDQVLLRSSIANTTPERTMVDD